MLDEASRNDRGVSMRNFKYNEAFDLFVQQLHAKSPEAYRLVREHFRVRSDRNMR